MARRNFQVHDVEQLAIPDWHQFASLDRVLITATRDAVESSTDQGGLPCLQVHKVRASLNQGCIGGRQAWFRIMESYNVNRAFLTLLSRNLLQTIHCSGLQDLEECLIKWDTRMQGGGQFLDNEELILIFRMSAFKIREMSPLYIVFDSLPPQRSEELV